MFLDASRYERGRAAEPGMVKLHSRLPSERNRPSHGRAGGTRSGPSIARRGAANGFGVEHFDEGGLTFALGAALKTWGTGTGAIRATWRKLQANGMQSALQLGRARRGVRDGLPDGGAGSVRRPRYVSPSISTTPTRSTLRICSAGRDGSCGPSFRPSAP